MTLNGVDVSSFQGEPAQWKTVAGNIDWAAVKFTEFQPSGTKYINPDAADDWTYLKQNSKGRIAYLFGHPATPTAETVQLFASVADSLGLDDGDVVALDYEESDGETPAHCASWGRDVLALLKERYDRPIVLYTFIDFATEGYCAGMGDYPLWISDPSHPAGHPDVPAPWKTFALHQYDISSPIDKDVATYATLTAMAAALGKNQPAPTPAPAPAPAESWQEKLMKALPEVKAGQKGQQVRNVQGLCVAHGYDIAVDGDFGPITTAAVKEIQTKAKITSDGIVGPATWPVMLSI